MIDQVTDLRLLTAMLKAAAGKEDDAVDPAASPRLTAAATGRRRRRERPEPDARIATAFLTDQPKLPVSSTELATVPPAGGPPGSSTEAAPDPSPHRWMF